MAEIERLEMEAHRSQLESDVQRLVDKYRAIFGWDVPDIDEATADALIIEAMHRSLEAIQRAAGERRERRERGPAAQSSSSVPSAR